MGPVAPRAAGRQNLARRNARRRIPNESAVTELGEDGRYRSRTESRGWYARWLPHVTIDVCERCNNGWMSELETAAMNALSPFLFDSEFAQLTGAQVKALATWATNCWMAC